MAVVVSAYAYQADRRRRGILAVAGIAAAFAVAGAGVAVTVAGVERADAGVVVNGVGRFGGLSVHGRTPVALVYY